MKGGVGKTTLCVNLAYEIFTTFEKKVLVVDNDPQFNATSALVRPKDYINDCLKTDKQPTTYNIYEKPPRVGRQKTEEIDQRKYFWHRWHKRYRPKISLDLIPSRLELYETLRNPTSKEYRLEKLLKRHGQEYEYIFIDCPPTPSVLTLSAFAASDYIIIPVTPDYFAAVGLPQFLATLEEFKNDLIDNHDIKPLGVIFTDVPRQLKDSTRRAMRDVSEVLAEIPTSPPLFRSILSHWSVLQKVLWQAKPVQQITGRGLRGKRAAVRQLRAIAKEVEEKIAADLLEK